MVCEEKLKGEDLLAARTILRLKSRFLSRIGGVRM